MAAISLAAFQFLSGAASSLTSACLLFLPCCPVLPLSIHLNVPHHPLKQIVCLPAALTVRANQEGGAVGRDVAFALLEPEVLRNSCCEF